ncbi:glycosyltransferase [bacterium]|nr:glycosyltransferase [bacterium]
MILSVVIIGRNEEANIERCLRSVLYAVKSVKSKEIIYVDSASTDRTIDIVKKYPVRIIKLRPEWPLTSSAGRYLGFRNTAGRYVFFVDGDTVIYKDWPERAIAFLEESKESGGVAGIVHEIFLDETGRKVLFRKNRYNVSGSGEVKVFGGIAVYKRSVLDKAGNFNPFIEATPELELALRIRNAGYKLMRIDIQMAITYAPERDTVKEVMRRAHSGLYSIGRAFRICRSNGLGLQYLKERMGFIIEFGVVIFFIFSGIAVSLLLKRTDILLTITGITAGVLLVISVKKRSVQKTILSIFKRSVILFCTIRSLFTGSLKDPDDYPEDVIIIKK